jgi:hypothetical protein
LPVPALFHCAGRRQRLDEKRRRLFEVFAKALHEGRAAMRMTPSMVTSGGS